MIILFTIIAIYTALSFIGGQMMAAMDPLETEESSMKTTLRGAKLALIPVLPAALSVIIFFQYCTDKIWSHKNA